MPEDSTLFSGLYGQQAQTWCTHTYMLVNILTHKTTNQTNTNYKAKQRRFIHASQNNTAPGL